MMMKSMSVEYEGTYTLCGYYSLLNDTIHPNDTVAFVIANAYAPPGNVPGNIPASCQPWDHGQSLQEDCWEHGQEGSKLL
jgi:hypothetical protein